MTVEIKVFGEDAEQALRELRGLSAGLFNVGPQLAPPYSGPAQASPDVAADAAARQVGENDREVSGPTLEAAEVAAKRRRGRPPKNEAVSAPAETAPVAETAPAISTTPEDRVNPDDDEVQNEEDDGIEEMLDAPGAKLTVDDLRNAAGRINRALGNNPARAQELAAPAFVKHGVKSISTCPDDKLAMMIGELDAVAAQIESGGLK